MSIYFDNAATTLMDDRVLDAMLPFMKNRFGNPSSVHSRGREVRTAIEKARKNVAELLHASPSEIFFTSGGTEADNTALFCAIESLNIKNVITSPTEHHAVLHPLEHCAKKGLIQLTLLEVDEKGNINLDQLQKLLELNPHALVSLMHANNEIGNIQDIESIGNLCEASGAFFHSDTVQTVGHYNLDHQSLPLHASTGSGHKFHGPKGSGFLFLRKNKKIQPYIYGGSQERNMRGGTENVAGIIGLAKALELSVGELDVHRLKIESLKKHFIAKLSQSMPGVGFNGLSAEMDKSLYTILNVSLPPSEENKGMVLFNLDLEGIQASGGSACSSGSLLGSHVLTAINHPPERDSIRFSFSRFNTLEEVDFTIDKLKELYTINA